MLRKRLLKTLVIIVPLAGLVVATVVIARAADSPSEGVIKTRQVASAAPRQGPGALMKIHGKTVSFQYPHTLYRTKADVLTAGDVEKFSFVNPTVPPWDLDIQIRTLPSGQLADDGSYNLRLHHPEQYVEQKLTINGALVSIMSDQTASFSKVAFLTHNGLVAEIALTSTDTANTDQLQSALLTVIQTWHWL